MKLHITLKKIPGKGLAVIAAKNFKTGEIIEACPVLRLSPTERKIVERTIMAKYIYPWRSVRSAAVVWGYGSMLNHSYTPNADWKQNYKTNRMVYRAIRPITKGREITVNYNGEPDDQTPIDWFEVI